MKPEPLILPRNCSTCHHYDGDHYCALPRNERQLAGAILEAESVVCSKHEPLRPEDVEGATDDGS